MSLKVAIGHSQEIDGYRAGLQAARQAFDRLARAPVAFVLLIAAHYDNYQRLLAGVTEVVGVVPVLGFSSSAVLTSQGVRRRGVAVALVTGDGLSARAGWWPGFSGDSQVCSQMMLSALQPAAGDGEESLFVVADGLAGDPADLCANLAPFAGHLVGCLAGGDLQRERSIQLGGRQSGSGGLAGLVLNGPLEICSAAAHGWQPVGVIARLTSVQGKFIRSIDGGSASQTYTQLFGFTPEEWASPPLKYLIRQYPLRLRDEIGKPLRAPLWVARDGSLRMNAVMPEDQKVDILVGSPQTCLDAARDAGRAALDALKSPPFLAVALVDIAWQTMFAAQPGEEFRMIRKALGDVPLLGAYTLGQLARSSDTKQVKLLDQHVQVVLFGETPDPQAVQA